MTLLDVIAVLAWIVVPGALYVIGLQRLRRAGSSAIGPGSAAVAVTGLTVLGAVLVPGVSARLEASFSGHMVQHLVLGVVGPLLVVIGRATEVVPWALGRSRSGVRRLERRARRATRSPLLASASLVAVWHLWHLPGLHDAAVDVAALHALEHLTVLGAGWWFWTAVAPHRRRGVASAAALFGALLGVGLLGAVLSLSPEPFYDAYVGNPASRLDDQRLGGLLMWTPGGLVYLVAAVVQVARWLGRARPDDSPPALLSRREVGLT